MEDVPVETEVTSEQLQEIREWLITQPFLPQLISDDQLQLFIHSCYSNIDLTKRTITKYYEMKSSCPEFFDDRNLSSNGLQNTLQAVQMYTLPRTTDKGYVVICARLKNSDASLFQVNDAVKLLFMVIDTVNRVNRLPEGIIFLFDHAGVTFRHLTKLSISALRKLFAYIQEANPVRLKAVHIVNVNALMTQVMALIKPFMGKQFAKLIYLHTPSTVEKLYEDIPKHLLPEEYGGDAGSVEDITQQTLDQINGQLDWFREDETFRIDKRKQPTGSWFSRQNSVSCKQPPRNVSDETESTEN